MTDKVQTNPARQEALTCAARGWNVLPVHSVRDGRCACGRRDCKDPGKHPHPQLAPNGLRNATSNPAAVEDWFRILPSALNYGIQTGEDSGIIVLDVDPRHGGDAELERLEREHGPLPATVEAQTGGGGRHLFFQHPGFYVASRNNAIAPGLDIKGDGGYVIGAGSLHASGRRYAWEASSHPDETPIAEAPGWLLNELRRREQQRAQPADQDFDPPTLDEVRRVLSHVEQRPEYDDWIRVIAATLDGVAGDVDAAEELLKAWSPEERPGEYRKKLQRPLSRVRYGTLVYMAKQNGYKVPRPALTISPGDGQAFPVADSKPQSDAPGHDYRAENGQMLIEVEKRNKKGEVYDVERKIISDFEARITEEVTDENGRRSYLIEGITFGERRRFSAEVDAATFEDDRQLKKVLGEAVGARASIRSGMSSHLAPAIKLNSTDVRRRLRYSRTGWAGDTFLVPGREREGVEIDLPNGLPYRVHAGDVEKGRAALRAALRAVDPSLTTVLLAYLLTAPIARYIRLLKKYALFIKGRTGTWKTSVAQVFMCLYGADFIRDESILKFGQGATGNALLHIASHVHDMPLMWDNYKPNVGGGEREFISFTHAAVEGSEKARLNRNGELQPRRELRCWPVCTGEDLPSSDAAALARLLCVEFSASAAATNPHLDTAQSLSEHLPALGNALIEWLESEEGRDAAARANEAYPAQRAKVAEYLRGVRSDMANALRAASNIASNRLVYEVVMECPVFSDILKEHQAAHAAGLQVCADRIASYTADSSEALRLLSGIKSLLAAERVRFDDRGSYPMGTHTDNRVKIGYRDSAGYYLLLDVAIEEVEKLYRRSGGLSGMSNQTICSQLLELGFVASTSKTKTTKLIKVNGDPVRVLHLVHGAIDEPAEEA